LRQLVLGSLEQILPPRHHNLCMLKSLVKNGVFAYSLHVCFHILPILSRSRIILNTM
jgi:hypothetical protein